MFTKIIYGSKVLEQFDELTILCGTTSQYHSRPNWTKQIVNTILGLTILYSFMVKTICTATATLNLKLQLYMTLDGLPQLYSRVADITPKTSAEYWSQHKVQHS